MNICLSNHPQPFCCNGAICCRDGRRRVSPLYGNVFMSTFFVPCLGSPVMLVCMVLNRLAGFSLSAALPLPPLAYEKLLAGRSVTEQELSGGTLFNISPRRLIVPRLIFTWPVHFPKHKLHFCIFYSVCCTKWNTCCGKRNMCGRKCNTRCGKCNTCCRKCGARCRVCDMRCVKCNVQYTECTMNCAKYHVCSTQRNMHCGKIQVVQNAMRNVENVMCSVKHVMCVVENVTHTVQQVILVGKSVICGAENVIHTFYVFCE